MTTGAIVMMVVSMTVLWGGLAVAVINITRVRQTPPSDQTPVSDGKDGPA